MATTLGNKKTILTLEELQLSSENRERINQLIEEFYFINALQAYNIPVDNKILLHGHTGCGKTATAMAIGAALNKNVLTLNLGGFVSSRLGETAKSLSDIFRKASNEGAILFLDEFDFIGKVRDYDDKDSGEMKRLVNTLIQQIDHLSDNSILICATNHLAIIDTALLRRFQIKLKYELPMETSLNVYYDSLLSGFPAEINKIKRSFGISYGEAKDSVYQQVKANIIQSEKNKSHLLFRYGNLENEQLQNFTRKLEGKKDTILGYSLVNDSTPSEANSAAIPIKSDDKIEGFVVTVSGEELWQTDKLKASTLKRVKATTEQGLEVWLYVSKK